MLSKREHRQRRANRIVAAVFEPIADRLCEALRAAGYLK